jgi:hypothetical protein
MELTGQRRTYTAVGTTNHHHSTLWVNHFKSPYVLLGVTVIMCWSEFRMSGVSVIKRIGDRKETLSKVIPENVPPMVSR